jgi:pyrroline-5-carboxylate reductase
MADMCATLSKTDGFADKLFVSIAAGLTVSRLQAMLGVSATVIRVMPNTPSLLGKGLTGIFAPTQATNEQRQFVIEMMEKVGKVVCVDNEADINGVIAAAGSSPAYFFYILEAMAEEAMRMGFTPASARLMVQEAMLGAAEMVCQNPQLSLADLRQQVTSKGGTTAAAIESLTQSGLSDTMSLAMRAAVARAEQMSASL